LFKMSKLTCLCTLFVLVGLSLAQNTVTYSYGSFDSSVLNQFQLNGEAAGLNPNGANKLWLTSNNDDEVGSAILKNPIALVGPNGFQASFSTAFSIQMTSPGGAYDDDGWGADGIVFSINSRTNIVGADGGGIGYQGLANSVGIEFDSWNNGYPIDINGNHVGVDINGNMESASSVPYPTRWNDGNVHYAWVDYNGESQTLEVRASDSATRPTDAILTYSVNLVAILGTPNVYVGFSAGTGSANENHYVNGWTFTNTYAPIITQPTSVCGNGIIESGEQCDPPGGCCSTGCTFSSTEIVCRPSSGICDLSETCTGTSATCPADSFVSSSVVCSPSSGVCQLASSCTGNSASCPANQFLPSTTVCSPSSGVCQLASTCTGSSVDCPANQFESSSTVCRPSVGPCDPPEDCTGNSVSCPPDINGSYETACAGLVLPQGEFTDYQVIAFGDFTANTGDIEQRLAVGGNFAVGDGWSVGYQVNTDDGFTPYSLLVAGNAVFGSGAVYPDGSGSPYNVPEEDMFIGGSFSGPSYLSDRVTSCSSSGCLNSYFAAALQCYNGYQATMAANSDNVNTTLQWSGLYINCDSVMATNYYMTLTGSQISSYTWVSTSNCNADANWIVNVVGNDDVSFSGGSFPYDSNQVIWNIQGSGRTINVGWTQVQGSILAPNNNINQPSGVIVGSVVANNINSLQINKVPCFTPAPTSVCGNGIVEYGEQCDGGSCCTDQCTFSPSTTVCRAAVSQCDTTGMCTGSSATCPPDVNYGFETACSGLDFPLNGGDYSFTDFDVIVFGSFTGGNGDVERRVAVQGDFSVGFGYSIGYEIDSTETFVPYALVVGGDASWSSGALYPNGLNSPFVAPEEYMFVGGTFTGSASLASLVTGSCGSNSGCLNNYFNAAQSCYGGFQTALANNADNVAVLNQWSTLTLTCDDSTAMMYYVTLTASDISSTTSSNLVNCNINAQWVVNVPGTDDITFSGGSFGGDVSGPGASQIVWNIQGSGRTINVGAYQFDGSLLSPYNTLDQTGGVIVGKVVVAEVTSMIQMNKYVCYDGAYAPSFIVSDK